MAHFRIISDVLNLWPVYIFVISHCFVLYNKNILTRHIKHLILNNQAIKMTPKKAEEKALVGSTVNLCADSR